MRYNRLWRSLLLAVVTLGPLLAACSPRPTPAPTVEGVVITFACYEHEIGQYEELAEKFHEANPRIKVQMVSIEETLELDPENWDWPEDSWRRLASAADTLSMWVSPDATRQGLVRDLTPFIEADRDFHRQDFYPNTLENLQWEGGTWGLPAGVSFDLIFYDKEAFDEAGVPYPEPGWTWNDFLGKAIPLTKRDGEEVTRWGFVQPWPNPLLFIVGRGVSLVDNSTTPPTPLLDQPAVAEAVRWYANLHLKHQVMPYFEPPEVEPGEPVRPEGDILIEDGKAAMWSDFSGNFERRSRQREIGIAPYPIEKPEDATTPISVWPVYAMSAGTSHPEEAWRWLDFLSHQPEARPFGAPFLPTRRSVAEEMGFWEDLDEEMAAAYRFALEHSLSWIGAYEVGGALHEALPAILKGEKSVEEALADAQIAARQALVEQEKEHEEATPQPVVVATPKPETGEGVAITFVPFFADTATYRELAEAFHDTHPEISVEVRELSFAGRFGMKDLASSSDCFAWFGEAGDEEALQEALNLEPFLEAERDLPLDDFYPQVLEPFRWRGDLWGLPAESSMKVIYYNKDLLNAAGVEYPRPGWDLDDFLTAAKALTRGEGDDKQYGFLPVHGHGGEVDTFITLRGASLVNDQAHPPRPRFDDPDVVEAVHWYVELATVHGVMPVFPGEDPSRPETSAWEKRQSLIREGKAAMWSDTVGSGTFFPEDLRRGIAPLPLGEGKMADLFVWGYYISKDTPYPRQCWEWIKFLSDHGLEATRGLPARRSAAESPQFRTKVGEEEAEVYLFSLERTEEVRSLYESPWLGRSHYWLLEALGHVMEGKDPEWALAEAQRKAEAYIMCLESKDGFADEEVQKACAKEVDPNYREFGEEE